MSAAPARYPETGVLIDVPNQRVLVGAPALLRSMFVQLTYLGGRYTTHFEKFDERTTGSGERVITWRIRWPEEGVR